MAVQHQDPTLSSTSGQQSPRSSRESEGERESDGTMGIKHKVAYLSTSYPEVSHTFIRRELQELERRGYEVTRFSIRHPKSTLVDPADLLEQERTTYLLASAPAVILATIATLLTSPIAFLGALSAALRLHQNSERGLIRHMAYLAEACLVRKLLAKRGIRHVHVHFGTNVASVALLAHRLGGVSYSMTVHGPDEFDAPIGFSLQQKVESSEFTVAISDFCAAQIRRWTPASEWTKIVVVHCTIDNTFAVDVSPVSEDSVTIVCVGRLSAQKGQLLLVEAVAQLVADGVDLHLLLVGDGELRFTIETAIRERGLEKHITITGWMTGSGVREHLVASRGLVLPSFAEGLPVVIMEALALARPVVTTHVAGIPELVEQGVNGWLVPAGQVAPLVEAIRELIMTPSTRLDEMGMRGRARVLQGHTPEAQVDRLAELFCSCLEKRR